MGKNEINKIVLVGPVYPYKTGLSYYVALLYKQLSKNHDTELISYSMLYPKILYGKDDKDYSDDVLKIDEAQFILNSANPFNCIKVANKIKKMTPDLVIFQWLHPYFAPSNYILLKVLGKKIKTLYICHNVFPHERFPMDKQLTKMALKPANFFITHSESDAEDLKSIIKNPKVKVGVHPTYDFFKQKNLTKGQARDILGIRQDEDVLLFFGLVREYKGLKHLINAMGLLKGRDKLKLIIAGDFCGHRQEYNELITNAGIEDKLIIDDRHIPIEEVEKYFAASDIVVLPYESATQSGVIQVAYSFEKPVLATNVGGLPDVVRDMQTGYLIEPFNPGSIAEKIQDFFDNNRADIFRDGVIQEKYRFSWERMEENIKEVIAQ
nr:glycosyltransferase family 4 protein [uncultured Butyrivibrio sp.]